jgi:hypothetical protein
MSELPDRPDLDQLRRQARELLRAATNGEARAVTRLRAVSERVTLSAAQLAVAREHGYPSWPALKAEVERRQRLSRSAASLSLHGGDERGSLGVPEKRWSFGGATAIETAAGILFPEALVVGPGHTTLYASLTPSDNGQPAAARPRRLSASGVLFGRWARRKRADAAVATMTALVGSLDEVTVVDNRGTRYTLRAEGMSGQSGRLGEPAGPMDVDFRLDPVPGRGVAWLELRSPGGAATRLLPSARAAVPVGQLAPAAVSLAERDLLDQALWLIELQLTNAGEAAEDILRQYCSAALARMAETQRSGELDPASELPDQVRLLCAVLTEHRPADRLPLSWSGMLDAGRRADGPRHHLDIGAALPPIDGVAVQVDSLISWPDSWRLYLRAMPGWWNYSEDRRRKWAPVSVYAEDDRGGTYVSGFGGGTGHGDHEELALSFQPRLDPLAHALILTFRGASEEVPVDITLESAADSQQE